MATKTDEPARGPAPGPAPLAAVRRQLATVIGVVCALAALFLALGVLLVAMRHNVTETNPLVKLVLHVDDAIDGPFSRDSGIFSFKDQTKDALANWGLAAVVYLVVGRVLARLVAPRR